MAETLIKYGNRSDHLQMLTLSDETGTMLAEAEVYFTYYYYTLSWTTSWSLEQFVAEIEKILITIEDENPHGVLDVDGRIRNLHGTDINHASYSELVGIQYKVHDDSEHEDGEKSVEMPYGRPFDWSVIQKHAEPEDIFTLRIETPLGDFVHGILPHSSHNFGLVSHLAQVDGFIRLMSESSGGNITESNARQFFEAMLGFFPKRGKS